MTRRSTGAIEPAEVAEATRNAHRYDGRVAVPEQFGRRYEMFEAATDDVHKIAAEVAAAAGLF